MHGGDVQVIGRESRGRSRLRVLLGLVPLAMVLAAVMPAPASADPKFDNGCRAQLTGEEGAMEAELTFDCADFVVTEVVITANKDFLAFPLAPGQQEGGFVCTPLEEPGQEATCVGESDAATIRLEAEDVCGTEDNRPLVVDLTLTGDDKGDEANINELQIQCQEPPDDGGGGGGGAGAGEDQGQTPQGGVQSGAGGAALAGGPSAGLLVLAGVIALAMLGLVAGRVRAST